MSDPQALIAALDLKPHPEGGWYRETWRAEAAAGERSAATAILFLLEQGQKSRWHKVDAAEMWLWHSGSPIALRTAEGDHRPAREMRLGPCVLTGETPQHLIPAHHWQAAEAREGWALMSCIVSPAFDFSGFTLAEPGWEPG